jgi:hypothetical protein
MKLWSAFYDYVLPDVPGCVPGMADFALRQAAIDWCEHTHAWKEYLDPQTISDGVTEYFFDISPLTQIVKLLDATYTTFPDPPDPSCPPIPCVRDLPVMREDALRSDWKTNTNCWRSPYILTLDRVSYFVMPQQCAGTLVTPHVAMKPSQTGTGISDDAFNQYAMDIANGAKARLMISPKKPYSSPDGAAVFQGMFEQARAAAAIIVGQSFSTSARRPRVRDF